ncbi:MAG: HNH endonuclease, partial [bacterium]|nr:HNH endonuclease [bacterium]
MAIRRSTVKEALLYHYALLITDAAVGHREGLMPVVRTGPAYWSFANKTFQRLVRGDINPSTLLRENKLLVSNSSGCAYCGVSDDLQWEHIIPRSAGGPDTIDNLVLACPECNLSKGTKDL